MILKRDGTGVTFRKDKIVNAIRKAGYVYPAHLCDIADIIEETYIDKGDLSVEDVQNLVEKKLMELGYHDVAKEYIRYRYKREIIRKSKGANAEILDIVNLSNQEVKEENSNKNPVILSTQRDYIAGAVSKELTEKLLLPPEVVDAHKAGIIHVHDMDYMIQKMYNCALINLEDILQNGTVINGTLIEKPHSFSTACNIATQVMAQVASNQYGGQSETLSHLAPFVDVSRQKLRRQVREELYPLLKHWQSRRFEDYVCSVAEDRLKEEITRGVQTMQYQINTLMTSNGQTPFVTIFMYLNEVSDPQTKHDLAMIIEEVVKQRLQGTKNEKGVYITPAFPKLIYVLEEDNITEDSPYYYLTQLCAKCSTKRLVPDYVSEKIMLANKVTEDGEGHCYPPMGCRSFLTPYLYEGKAKFYGRFNQGVVTINLVDVGLSANGDFDEFWKLMDERCELCHKALRVKHQNLKGTISDVSPIHWQYGAIARLKKGETIDKLLEDGYSTISLGYAGLYECVKAMTGKSHTEAKDFALSIMKFLNDKCALWKSKEGLGYSVYGTPIETTTYKFAKCLKDRFGVVKDITDHDYITNSYHVHVKEPIDAFTKLAFESEFQLLSPGGAVSYIETTDMSHNLSAVMSVLRYIYDTIMYAELNCKSDYCQKCGYDGEIKIVTDNNVLLWECPCCGNRDKNTMNVARRTCGYIGSQYWNPGRTEEIRDRYVHLGGDEPDEKVRYDNNENS